MKKNLGFLAVLAMCIMLFFSCDFFDSLTGEGEGNNTETEKNGDKGKEGNGNEYSSLISFDVGRKDTWGKVSYESLETGKRQKYTKLIIDEMNKYPNDFFTKIGLDIIIIGKNLKFEGTFRASVPDNGKKILFMGIRDDYTDDYLKHVFHHELNHYVEYHIWGSHRHDWEPWRKLFDGEGGGGELAYQNGENSNSMVYNPDLPGFLNYYSTLGQEEDRSEMIAFFLTEKGNKSFVEKAEKDNIFRQKSILLFEFYKDKFKYNLFDEYLLLIKDK